MEGREERVEFEINLDKEVEYKKGERGGGV